jgi:phosphatidylglycerol:prolipoprotein diacylglycerol transferase
VQSFLSFGRLHIPIHGLCVAAGLMCTMALSLRTARMARVDPDALWDSEMVAVLSAFLLSRALLVIENIHTFLQFPALVLELPSLTLGGLFGTAILTLAYLHHRRLRMLNVLDALAPCTALLLAFFYLGDVADGTREGMPSSVPWAISSSFGRVHPVEIYASIVWLAFCAGLLWVLRRQRHTGETGAWAMTVGGLLQFFLCFFRLPQVLYGRSMIDGSQQRALYLTVAGGLLLAWRLGLGARPAIERAELHDAV